MHRFWPSALLAALFAAVLAAATLAAANFPTLTGRVVDDVHILSSITIADLERKSADLEQKSGIQLVVVSVPSLDGEEIEPYATALFNTWKIGQAKQNNGVLLLIAPKERRIRIEVGRGLEGTLTNAVCSDIIVNAIAPRFKAGDYNGGVTRAVDDIIAALAEWKPKQTDERAEHEPQVNAPLQAPTDRMGETAIPMVSDRGTFKVPVTINGQLTLKFVVDSGASDVSIPADVVGTLVRTETITDADFLGKQTYQMADGSTVPSERFVIRSLKVGDKTLENVTGSIAPVAGSLLLGQSFLSRFKSWSIDNHAGTLILN
jgi:clan AA aspartic protease (TIGR02281 family)